MLFRLFAKDTQSENHESHRSCLKAAGIRPYQPFASHLTKVFPDHSSKERGSTSAPAISLSPSR